ncbi:MBL fold metallo-hydrolase [Deltaproteobacteria bacterium Smac51]|nr:MBL fold metallo-hydrolase [Deltaproteobacteria bacterium Smac51]
MTKTAKNPAPGFYRQTVGSITVTALYDGFINLSPSLFHGLERQEMEKLINRKFQTLTSEGVPTAVTTYLIDNGSDLIILNAGGAGHSGMGGIFESLKCAGYSPEDISAVLLTHMHFDHVCGLAAGDGSAAFPNASVFVSEAESDFWLDPKIAQAAPEGSRPFFAMAAGSIAPYITKGAFSRFKSDDMVFPGVKAVPSPGHTPGHTSFLISSEEATLLLWGDIVHSHALQFGHPEVTNDFDSDQPQAAATRRKLFEMAASEKWLIGGDHLPFPGFGHITESGEGYSWVPVEYGPQA